MFGNYLNIAFRSLWKSRLYSTVNLIGLTVGLAGSILILLYVHYEYSFDQFHEDAYRIYRINQRSIPEGAIPQYSGLTVSPLAPILTTDYSEINAVTRVRIFDIKSLFYHEDKSFYISNVAFVDSTFFEVFSFPLQEGDPHTALTKPNSIVLGKEMAQRLFGDELCVGKSITWGSSKLLEVTGVMRKIPANSHLVLNGLVSWDVAEQFYPWMNTWSIACLATYVRFSNGAIPEEFNQKLQEIIANHLPPEELKTAQLYLQPMTDIHLGSPNIIYQYNYNPGNLTNVRILTAIAVIIILLACINYTNLTTARTVKRSIEVGIRKVTGAKRIDLIFQFLMESMLMSFLALLLAMVLVELLLPVFRTITDRDVTLQIFHYPWTWVIIFGSVAVIGLVSGIYPAFYLSRFHPIYVFRALRWTGSHGAKLRSILVVLQFTISAALIISTLIIIKQLRYWHTMDLGFSRERVVVVPLNGREAKTQLDVLKAKLLENPSITRVSALSNIPGEAFPQMSIEYEGMSEGQEWSSAVLTVDYEYRNALGAHLVSGRDFSPDISTDATESFIINETATKQLGWENPVGKTLRLPFFERKGKIIGVINDFHYQSLHHAIEPLVVIIEPKFYAKLLVCYDGQNVSTVIATIRKVWEEFTPMYPFEYSFLDADIDNLYGSEQRTGLLLMIFSGLSIFIGGLGLFGLTAFIAEQKTKEIGIRKTLGASVASIVILLTRNFTLWVIISNLIACPIGYYVMTRWLENFAYKAHIGYVVFATALGFALIITLITVGFQAIKAAVANPVDSLRYE